MIIQLTNLSRWLVSVVQNGYGRCISVEVQLFDPALSSICHGRSVLHCPYVECPTKSVSARLARGLHRLQEAHYSM